MQQYTFIGTTDEVTQCGCCGRDNLKGTVVLKDTDGEFVFFGSACGARAMGWEVKEFNKGAKAAEKERRNAIRNFKWQHANEKKIRDLCNDAAAKGMTFAERRTSGLLDTIRALRAEIEADAETQFGKF